MWEWKRWRGIVAAVLCCMATGPVFSGAHANDRQSPDQPDAASILTASQVRGLTIVPLADLPGAPGESDGRKVYEHLLVPPKNEAGRRVENLGWAVTGEVQAGRFQAISFAGGFEPGTSGSCLLRQGNIGFFEKDRLVALAYAPKSSEATIGMIVPLDGGGARIWDGEFLRQPVGDIRLIGDTGIAIVPLASEERFCNGKSVVPNIYGMPIALGRVLLQNNGWTAFDHGDADRRRDSRAAGLAKQGIHEVEECSGTGFGFCSYDYRGQNGTLSVVTVGDAVEPATPVVSGYSVLCPE